MTHKNLEDLIEGATKLGQRLEDLVVGRGKFTVCCDRDDLLMAYWSLLFEHDKGILCLLRYKFYAPAFALWRPLMESLARSCVSLVGSADEVSKIRKDRYKADLVKVGVRVDQALGLESPLFDGLYKTMQKALHSFTHSGTRQLNRRFEGNDVGANYPAEGIQALITSCASAVFAITLLVTRHFHFEHEEYQAMLLWNKYGSMTLEQARGHSAD
jgi:uncharacterized protein DUF6988